MSQAFENQIKIISTKKIEEQINSMGKAVLYINFATDKSTLKQDGQIFK